VTAKLEEAVARLMDSIDVQVQHSKAVDQRLHTMQSFMNQPKPTYGEQKSFSRPYSTENTGGTGMNCFYCEGPHRIGGCEHVQAHLDSGLVKKVEGRLKLADGSRLPREVGKSTKELVEALQRAGRAGLIPMAKIQDKANLYQRVQVSCFAQCHAEENDERLVQELICSLGTEKVRQYLQTREEYNAEAEDWEQNFY